MHRFFKQLFLLLLLIIIKIVSIKSDLQCQPITYYECKNIGYNQTHLPNKFNHQDQKDVALVVRKRKIVPQFFFFRIITSILSQGLAIRMTCVCPPTHVLIEIGVKHECIFIIVLYPSGKVLF
jgi:hypothetical protein